MSQSIHIAELRRRLKSGELKSAAGQHVFVARGLALESIDEAARTVTYVMTDATQDLVGDRLSPEGGQIPDFLRNAQFLWAHNQEHAPIGKWIRVWFEQGKLKGTAWYATEDIDGGMAAHGMSGEKSWRMVKAGMLSAVSICFVIFEAEFNGEGLDIKSWKLLECSQVTVPMNPNALVDGKSASELEQTMATKGTKDDDKDGAGGGDKAKTDTQATADQLHEQLANHVKAIGDHVAVLADHAKAFGGMRKDMGEHLATMKDSAAASADHAKALGGLVKALTDVTEPEADDKKSASAVKGGTPGKLSKTLLDRVNKALDNVQQCGGHLKAVVDAHSGDTGQDNGTDGKGAKSLSPDAVAEIIRDEMAKAKGRLDAA